MIGNLPFDSFDKSEIIRMTKEQEIDFSSLGCKTISEQSINFLRNLIVRDQNQRMSAECASEHPWIADSEGNIKISKL